MRENPPYYGKTAAAVRRDIYADPMMERRSTVDKAVFYIQTGSVEPDYNLALEEYILTHRTAGSYLLLWAK